MQSCSSGCSPGSDAARARSSGCKCCRSEPSRGNGRAKSRCRCGMDKPSPRFMSEGRAESGKDYGEQGPTPVRREREPSRVVDVMWQVRPSVPAQTWHDRARRASSQMWQGVRGRRGGQCSFAVRSANVATESQSQCSRCGSGQRSCSSKKLRSPGAMWRTEAESRSRCGQGEPS